MWGFYAVASSFFVATYYILNQNAKLKPLVFMIYRGFVPDVLLFFLLPFAKAIPSGTFYGICILQGLIIAYIDYVYFKAFRMWGAEVVSSIQPFNIGMIFFLWFVIRPESILVYLSDLPRLFCILACLCGVAVAVMLYNRAEFSRKALHFLLPCLIVSSLCDILNKYAMSLVPQSHLLYGSYFYIMITGAVSGCAALIVYLLKGGRGKEVFEARNLRYSWIILPLIGSMLFKNFAMFSAFNPSYVGAVSYVYIIWIMLYNTSLSRFGKKAGYLRINRRAAMLLALSATGLILFAR